MVVLTLHAAVVNIFVTFVVLVLGMPVIVDVTIIFVRFSVTSTINLQIFVCSVPVKMSLGKKWKNSGTIIHIFVQSRITEN